MSNCRSRLVLLACCCMALLAGCASQPSERPAAIRPAMSTPTSIVVYPTATGTSAALPASPEGDAPSLIPTPTPSPTPIPPPAFDPATMTIGLEPLADGFDAPVFITQAGDGSGRFFVVEQGGLIHILRDGVKSATPFLDVAGLITDAGSEQGLLGLIFDPDFAENGYFFINYTAQDDATVIARYRVDPAAPDQADVASAFEILRVEQPASNHNAGMLAFGPDGYLYVGLGDGGGANDRYENGQNPAALLGKMLRLDVTGDRSVPYLIPPDNPWREANWDGVDVLDEIWAVGLRNPWRYSFDRVTGELWIGDVGQSKFEEINRVSVRFPAAINFGWPIMEGTHCFPDDDTCEEAGLTLPVTDYAHADGNCSVTGGYVYRGAAYPALAGVYFFGDYCSGNIWALWQDGADAWQKHIVVEGAGSISSFGEDEAGELYVIDRGGGAISRIVLDES